MIAIIGAGLAGLTAARTLLSRGVTDFVILEASDKIGGRVATSFESGFCFDEGFAVLNPAYPMVQRYLDTDQLALGYFDAGALLLGESRTVVKDPFQHPEALPSMLVSGFPSLKDKVLTLKLKMAISETDFPSDQEEPTFFFLRSQGFSHEYIEKFFRPFFAGVLLDNELSTSKGLFRYLYRFFSQGRVGLPKKGMAGVAANLAAPIPEGNIRLNSPVTKVEKRRVTLQSGDTIDPKAVIVAVDPAAPLLRERAKPKFRSVTTLYFRSDAQPWQQKLLGLNTVKGPVNHIAPLSLVQESYAPANQALISVNLIGLAMRAGTVTLDDVRQHLQQIVGPEASRWELLKTVEVEKALPARFGRVQDSEIFYAGDHTVSPSIQGAMLSGEHAALNALSKL